MAKQKGTVTEYRSYYLPMHFPVLLLSGDYWKISDVPSGRLHFHNCLEIGICHSDSGCIEFFGEPLSFKAGDVTVIPKNIPHTTYSSPGTESHWSYIYLDPQELFRNMLPAAWKNYDFSVISSKSFLPILSQEKYPFVYQLVLSVIRELEEQKPSYQLSAKGLLLSLYIELLRIENQERTGGGSKTASKESQRDDSLPNTDQSEDTHETEERDNALVIAPALDYIEENYHSQFTIEHLADLCHWSPTHFRRVFHDIMGTSPLDFINNTRITKACNLLRSTEDSILNISEAVGFHSVSSFNRYFIKIMQLSPRDYRKQMQKSDKRMENQTILEYAGWMYPEK